MVIYSLEPEFGYCHLYELFFARAGGKHWVNIQTPIENLKKSLQEDKDFRWAIVEFGMMNIVVKDEEVDVVHNSYLFDSIIVKVKCQAAPRTFEKVRKTVVVDGQEYTREETVPKIGEYSEFNFERVICVSKIVTAD